VGGFEVEDSGTPDGQGLQTEHSPHDFHVELPDVAKMGTGSTKPTAFWRDLCLVYKTEYN
jgi:hypothetical protein